MAFMVPGADYFTADEVHTMASEWEFPCNAATYGADECTCKGGWYGNLSAPGYLDRTDYMGPYATAQEAIAAVCEFYGVDNNGDDLTDGDA